MSKINFNYLPIKYIPEASIHYINLVHAGLGELTVSEIKEHLTIEKIKDQKRIEFQMSSISTILLNIFNKRDENTINLINYNISEFINNPPICSTTVGGYYKSLIDNSKTIKIIGTSELQLDVSTTINIVSYMEWNNDILEMKGHSPNIRTMIKEVFEHSLYELLEQKDAIDEYKLQFITKARYLVEYTMNNIINGEELMFNNVPTHKDELDMLYKEVKRSLEAPSRDISIHHNTWVKNMVADGWVYGRNYSIEEKTHPYLMYYDDLTDPLNLSVRLSVVMTNEFDKLWNEFFSNPTM